MNNNVETFTQWEDDLVHEKAASISKYLNESDEDLEAVISQIKALPNVAEVDSPADALPTLQNTFGIYPRVAYSEPNNKLLTISRNDEENGIYYTFAYSYKFDVNKGEEPTTFELQIEGEGVPYYIDDWTGEVSKIAAYEVRDGRTCVDVTLIPGEAMIIALDKNGEANELHAVSTTGDAVVCGTDGVLYVEAEASGSYETVLSNGETISSEVTVPEALTLDTWDLVIEDWNEGDKVVNTEEKFGHVTTEVYYETKKTNLEFPGTNLVAWKDLPATAEQLALLAGDNPSMEHVSGIGTYSTTFVVPEDWDGISGAYLDIQSAGGGTVAVYVNGEKAPGMDLRVLRVNISDQLKSGENSIVIEVSSTLTNRMLQRGYNTQGPAQEYGLIGLVNIVPYVRCAVS